MQRRKYLAALGSLAAGGAAIGGTGAFTSVEANRGLEVEVADDADALLGIAPGPGSNGSEYVDVTNGVISIDISSDDGGSGLNNNAVTRIENLLEITNQGSQEVYVWASGLPGSENSNPRVALGTGENSDIENAGTGSEQNQANVNPAGSGGAFSTNSSIDSGDIDGDVSAEVTDNGDEAAPLLAPGNSLFVELFAYGDLTGLDFDQNIKIHAVTPEEIDQIEGE